MAFPIESLPSEVIYELSFRLGLKEIYNLCPVNRWFSLFLASEFFWKGKCYHDFTEVESDGSWKETYRERTFNEVLVFGANNFGQLGLGDTERRKIPTPLPSGPVRAKRVATGDYHTLLLDLSGNVWTFGGNNRGQLGIGTIDNEPHPVPYPLPGVKARSVFAGPYQSFFATLDSGALWAFGDNEEGQLGIGKEPHVCTPKQVTKRSGEPLRVTYVSSHKEYTLAVGLQGEVWIFNSILGVRQIIDLNFRVKPQGVAVCESCSIGIDTNSELRFIDAWVADPLALQGLKARSITSSRLHVAIIDLDGTVHLFGPNGSRFTDFYLHRISNPFVGPITIPEIKARKVAISDHHCLIIAFDRSVWTFGWGISGEMGLNLCGYTAIPKQIPGFKASCASTMNEHTIILGRRYN